MSMTPPTAAPSVEPAAFNFPTAQRPHEGEKVHAGPTTVPDEHQLDEAIAQSFPASDPVSVTVSPPPRADGLEDSAPSQPAARAAEPGAAAWATAALLSTVVVGAGVATWLIRQRRRPRLQVPAWLPSALPSSLPRPALKRWGRQLP